MPKTELLKDERTEQFMFILLAGISKPVCLICFENVALIRSGNVKRHYQTKPGTTFIYGKNSFLFTIQVPYMFMMFTTTINNEYC